MEINCWIEAGVKDSVKRVRGSNKDATALRAAIRSAREDERTDDEVLWEQERLGSGVRNGARLVLGLGSTVVVFLLVAVAVVGSDTRSTLLAVLAGVVIVGGGFVAIVWQVDFGVTIHADGTLRRAGWNGESEMNLRRYRRVTVKRERASHDDGFGVPGV